MGIDMFCEARGGSKSDGALSLSWYTKRIRPSNMPRVPFVRKGAAEEVFSGDPAAVRALAKTLKSGVSIPTVYVPSTDKLYLMLMPDSTYLRCQLRTRKIDENYPLVFADYWRGVKAAGFEAGISAALWWDSDTAYLFKGADYLRYSLKNDKVDEGYPQNIAVRWDDFADTGFSTGIDAAFRCPPDWSDSDSKPGDAFFFRNDKVILFRGGKVAPGFPMKIGDLFPELGTAGVTRVLAAWASPHE
ncbi:hemopexin repeat-containing protein [Streptomyces noursei]|uniref:hemopexin repeat-containing protein n=1 Tax=Streptomyces noursei TaxID=1971 RepID=UPI0033E2D172